MPDSSRSIEYCYTLIDKYSSVVKNMSKHTKDFATHSENSFNKVIKKLNLFGINVSSILSAAGIIELTKRVVNFGKECVKSFEEQDVANKMVQKSLDITKNKVGKTFQELSDNATELQSKTFFGDESILMGATNTLLRFTSITGKEFDRIQNLTLDVSAGMQGLNANQSTLASTARYLAIAYERPEMAMRTLRMMNIILSDEENKMIQSMVKNGNVLKAREFILKKIESRYKGMAEEITKSSAGMDKQTKELIGDLQEVIGKGLVPLKIEFQKGLIQILKESLPLITEISKLLIFFISNVLVPLLKYIKPFIPTILKLVTVFFLFKGALMAVTIASRLFGLALAGTPLGFFIATCITLGVILTSMGVDWKKVGKSIKEVTLLLKAFFETADTANLDKIIKKWGAWGVIVVGIADGLDKIAGFISYITKNKEAFEKTVIGKKMTEQFEATVQMTKEKGGWAAFIDAMLHHQGEISFIDAIRAIKTPSSMPKSMPKSMPNIKTTAQNVNVKNSLDINVKADKGTQVTSIKNKDNLGTQRKKIFGVF